MATKKDEYENKYTPKVTESQAALDAARASLNQNNPYEDRMNAARDAYLNKGKFNYSINGDALYQQYKDAFTRGGQQAMKDTIAQGAALTGGYGNSYAQSAGQQMYNQYMQGLADKVPELEALAYERYQNDKNDLLNQYGILSEADEADYARRQDAYNRALNELGTYSGLDADERNFAYQKARDAESDEQWQKSFDYQKERDKVADGQWASEYSLNSAAASAKSNQKSEIDYSSLGYKSYTDMIDSLHKLSGSGKGSDDTLIKKLEDWVKIGAITNEQMYLLYDLTSYYAD